MSPLWGRHAPHKFNKATEGIPERLEFDVFNSFPHAFEDWSTAIRIQPRLPLPTSPQKNISCDSIFQPSFGLTWNPSQQIQMILWMVAKSKSPVFYPMIRRVSTCFNHPFWWCRISQPSKVAMEKSPFTIGKTTYGYKWQCLNGCVKSPGMTNGTLW